MDKAFSSSTPNSRSNNLPIFLIKMFVLLCAIAFLVLVIYFGIQKFYPKASIDSNGSLNLESTESTKSVFEQIDEKTCANYDLDNPKITKGIFLEYDSTQRVLKTNLDNDDVYIVGYDTTEVVLVSENCKLSSVDLFETLPVSSNMGVLESSIGPTVLSTKFKEETVQGALVRMDRNVVIYVY